MLRSYALMDFDGTLLHGDSIVRFIAYARQKGLCTRAQTLSGAWAGIRYKLGLLPAHEAKQRSLSFLAGRTAEEVGRLVNAFYDDVLRPALYKDGLAELRRLQEEGKAIVLVTASPTFYLEPLREVLGLAAIIGTRMGVDENGVYTGLLGDNCKAVQKPLRIAEYLAACGDRLDYDGSVAYGDSRSDLPMLKLCGRRVLVNPKPRLWLALRRDPAATVARWQ